MKNKPLENISQRCIRRFTSNETLFLIVLSLDLLRTIQNEINLKRKDKNFSSILFVK